MILLAVQLDSFSQSRSAVDLVSQESGNLAQQLFIRVLAVRVGVVLAVDAC
jgi:hypothetical protein